MKHINNKYIRNRIIKNKSWNKAKKLVGGEFSQSFFNPYWRYGELTSFEQQLADHQEYLSEHWVRAFLSGNPSGHFHATKEFKKTSKRQEKREIKQLLHELTKNPDFAEDVTIPSYKHDADWLWF